MRRVLATDFAIWPTLQDMGRISDAMLASDAQRASLANYLLLYDQIVVPTGNLQILPVLRLALGEAAFDQLVRDRVIVFARYDQWFGYLGNGHGLSFFKINDNPEQPGPPNNLGLAYFQPLDEAIDTVLAATNPPSDSVRRSIIKNLLIDSVFQVPLDTIIKLLKNETYRDILGSPYLRNFFALRNLGRPLDHLLGIKSDSFRICVPHTPPEPGDSREIGALLDIALENFILSIGTLAEVTDVTGNDQTLTVIQAKGQRFGSAVTGADAFTQIQKISGVPDLGSAFAAGRLPINQLIQLRESKHCQALRDWMAKGAPGDDAEDIVARYTGSLAEPGWIESAPARLIRLGVTNGVGIWNPVAGILASGVDSFLLSRWFPGKSPRLFLKQAKLMMTRPPLIAGPTAKGRDRNELCPCGSGRKYKRCHGQT